MFEAWCTGHLGKESVFMPNTSVWREGEKCEVGRQSCELQVWWDLCLHQIKQGGRRDLGMWRRKGWCPAGLRWLLVRWKMSWMAGEHQAGRKLSWSVVVCWMSSGEWRKLQARWNLEFWGIAFIIGQRTYYMLPITTILIYLLKMCRSERQDLQEMWLENGLMGVSNLSWKSDKLDSRKQLRD